MNTPTFKPGHAVAAQGPLPALIYMHNADLVDSCRWVPTDVRPGTTPLPIYPAPGEPLVEVVQ